MPCLRRLRHACNSYSLALTYSCICKNFIRISPKQIQCTVHHSKLCSSSPTMSKPTLADAPSSWTNLQNEFELRETVKFSDGNLAEDSSLGKGTISHDNALPSLPPPTRNRKILLVIGLVLASLDLCILPITYFYSLTFGAKLSRQTGMDTMQSSTSRTKS
jgi:hypothetical protein